MGSFANSLFKFMLGWLQGAVSAVWSAFTNEKGNTVFNWIGKNWILIAGILCAIGLAADLCVYIFRWKPFRVWKSFFTRNSGEEPAYKEQNRVPEDNPRRPVVMPGKNPVRNQLQTDHTDSMQEPDFSQWEEEKEEQGRPADSQPAEKPATVTNAGYIVPEDSPYRRPAVHTPAQKPYGQDTVSRRKPDAGTERKDPNPLAPRRRRRINVTELFTDPEEELRQFDAPQNVIDSRKAYRDPVYPRGWQKSEDKEG